MFFVRKKNPKRAGPDRRCDGPMRTGRDVHRFIWGNSQNIDAEIPAVAAESTHPANTHH
jgi:hypothetical protein